MNAHYTYLILLITSLFLPLVFSFNKKISFNKKWKFIIPAIFIPAVFFVVWDIWFTDIDIWNFNPAYIAGIYLLGLPIEEILFFLVVPYCCLFIYECMNIYFPKINRSRISDDVFLVFGVLLIATGIFYYESLYTSITFLATGSLIIVSIMSGTVEPGFNSKRFIIVFGVVMIPFLAVNGILTAIPIVTYNATAITGLKIYTIPIEDFFYEMLLFLWNVILFEWLEYKSTQNP